jgi:P-type conjugative transfer protein TrbJ
MKKIIGAVLLMLASTASFAQYIVFDPTNYAENLTTAAQTVESVLKEAQQYSTQLLQYENEVKQLASIGPEALNTLKNVSNVNLNNVNGYINSLNSLYGNLSGMSNQISTQFSAAQLSNMTWDQYMAKQKQDIQNGIGAAQIRAQNESNTLNSIQQDYAMAQEWQSQIPTTSGIHESMQLMNQQMNRVVMQNAQLMQQLQSTNGSSKAMDDMNKAIAKQRNNDALQSIDQTINTDNGNMSSLVNGLTNGSPVYKTGGSTN